MLFSGDFNQFKSLETYFTLFYLYTFKTVLETIELTEFMVPGIHDLEMELLGAIK